MLVTRDLNLTSSMLVQFYFMFGCNTVPVKRDQGVLLDYSPDGGITWEPLAELYYNLYRTPTWVVVMVPVSVKHCLLLLLLLFVLNLLCVRPNEVL